ncbi:MAG: tRNA (guanosine(37)-N1)-methyltransferase TrmD [Campylobacterales bacterium]
MRFYFATLFPELITPYFDASILGRAKSEGVIEVVVENPRDYTTNKHRKVDDYQAGGGAGLVLSPQPLFDLADHIRQQDPDVHIIVATPAGKPFRQNDARRLASKRSIMFVCGRYEGIDERFIEVHADELFSIGDYVLTGGELAALVMSDAIARQIPGVLGNEESLEGESFGSEGLLEAPVFGKPNNYLGLSVPSEYLKGNHSKISALKSRLAVAKTRFHRPEIANAVVWKDKR